MTYIDPRGKVFRHLARFAAWDAGDRPAPVTVEWDLSNRCVLGCQDCHFAHTHVRGPWATRSKALPMAYDGTGDLADVDLVMRGLDEMAEAGVQAVVWSGGGEPTTHPHWLPIVDYAAAKGFQQGMYTLGGLLSDNSAAVLRDKAAWVVVSLDTADAATYAKEKGVPPARFHAACAGLAALTGGQAVVGASFLLHDGNWTRAGDMVELARSFDANYTVFRPAVRVAMDHPGRIDADREWVTEAMPYLAALAEDDDVEIDLIRFEQYRDWQSHGYDRCLGIRLSTVVTPDGRLWACTNRRGMANSCLGDLRTESFGAVWARHPGQWTDFSECRAMCRLHPINETLAALSQPREHEAFV